MPLTNKQFEPTGKQITILLLLLQKNYIQKDLQKALKMTSAGLLYHLNKLEEFNYIKKKTLQRFGSAKINEISIDPIRLQHLRWDFNIKTEGTTLLTGFGELNDGYMIPDESLSLLSKSHFNITRIVCITTRKGKNIRLKKQKEKNLNRVAKYYSDYEYLDFRNINSPFFKELDNLLRKELFTSNIIIDITPLSKLYTLELLKRANYYKLACFYIGKDENGDDSIMWMTDVQLNGFYK